MLHSDQSHEALRGAHLGGNRKCSRCGRNIDWWRGVVTETKQGAKWVCAACAVLYETDSVFPPDGYVRWWFHMSAWKQLGLPEITSRIGLMEHTIDAITLAVAWGLESEIFDSDGLKRGTFKLAGSSETKPVEFPVVVRRPGWWAFSGVPHLHIYHGSAEEQDIASVIRAVLGVDPDAEWTRAGYVVPTDFRWNWQDPWPTLGKWAHPLPDSHPDVAQGVDKIMLVPVSGLREGANFDGHPIQKDHKQRITEAMLGLIQSRCLPEGETRPPSLWEKLGWTR